MFSLNKYSLFICLGVIVGVFASGFFLGKKITKDFYLYEIKQMELTASQSENYFLTKKIDIENDLKLKTNEVFGNDYKSIQDLDNDYDSSLLLLSDGVQSNGGSTSKVPLSEPSEPSGRVSADPKCKCNSGNNENFKRLSEKLLKLAKEHDKLKIKYNSLITIWQHTEKELRNFE